MTKEEYFKLLNSAVIVREWQVEDIDKMSIVQNPANETMLSFFKDQTQRMDTIITFSAENEEKQTIRGLVMRSGQWIPRYDIDGKGNFGYCYLSKATVHKMYQKFFSNKLTINHSDEITGDAILTNSWEEFGKYENGNEYIDWKVEYRVLTKKLWQYIKQNPVGFSLEGYFSAVKLSNE